MAPGEKVICLVNFFTGGKENVAQWIGHPRFDLIRHYVTEPIKLEVNRIWHLPRLAFALPAKPDQNGQNPLSGHLQHAGPGPPSWARLLLTSTSEVYDDMRSISSPRLPRLCQHHRHT